MRRTLGMNLKSNLSDGAPWRTASPQNPQKHRRGVAHAMSDRPNPNHHHCDWLSSLIPLTHPSCREASRDSGLVGGIDHEK
jgi:hypothetical protein